MFGQRPPEWGPDAPQYGPNDPKPKTRADGRKLPVPYLDERGQRCVNMDVEYQTAGEVRERLHNQMHTLGFGDDEDAFVRWATRRGGFVNLGQIPVTPHLNVQDNHRQSAQDGQTGRSAQDYRAGHSAQDYRAGHSAQDYRAGLSARDHQAGRSAQGYQGSHSAQDHRAGHSAQDYRGGHSAQYNQAAPLEYGSSSDGNLNYTPAGVPSMRQGPPRYQRMTAEQWADMPDYDRRLMAQLGISDPKEYFRAVYLAPYGGRLLGHSAMRASLNVKPGVDYQKELQKLLERGFKDADEYHREIEKLMACPPETPSRQGIDAGPGFASDKQMHNIPGWS